MGLIKRIAVLVAVLAAVPLLALGWAWWRSEAHLASFQQPRPFAVVIPTDPAALARGEHLARTRGCIGCHGDGLGGEVFDDTPWYAFGRSVAPNLPALARQVDAAALEAAIRHGIGHDGRALYSMPSFNFVNLSDGDTADLIGYIRSLPVPKTALPAGYLGLAPRWEIAMGRDSAVPYFITRTPLLARAADPDPRIRTGEYLAMTSCNECHGFGLRGDSPFDEPGKGPPDLAGARGYSRDQFFTLMRTGMPPDGRKLRLMDRVARGRYAHWTDEEVDALYAFLLALR